MYLRKLKIRNFQGVRKVEIDFEKDYTILIGENGWGKTACINALNLILGYDNIIDALCSFDRRDLYVPFKFSKPEHNKTECAGFNLDVDVDSVVSKQNTEYAEQSINDSYPKPSLEQVSSSNPDLASSLPNANQDVAPSHDDAASSSDDAAVARDETDDLSPDDTDDVFIDDEFVIFDDDEDADISQEAYRNDAHDDAANAYDIDIHIDNSSWEDDADNVLPTFSDLEGYNLKPSSHDSGDDGVKRDEANAQGAETSANNAVRDEAFVSHDERVDTANQDANCNAPESKIDDGRELLAARDKETANGEPFAAYDASPESDASVPSKTEAASNEDSSNAGVAYETIDAVDEYASYAVTAESESAESYENMDEASVAPDRYVSEEAEPSNEQEANKAVAESSFAAPAATPPAAAAPEEASQEEATPEVAAPEAALQGATADASSEVYASESSFAKAEPSVSEQTSYDPAGTALSNESQADCEPQQASEVLSSRENEVSNDAIEANAPERSIDSVAAEVPAEAVDPEDGAVSESDAEAADAAEDVESADGAGAEGLDAHVNTTVGATYYDSDEPTSLMDHNLGNTDCHRFYSYQKRSLVDPNAGVAGEYCLFDPHIHEFSTERDLEIHAFKSLDVFDEEVSFIQIDLEFLVTPDIIASHEYDDLLRWAYREGKNFYIHYRVEASLPDFVTYHSLRSPDIPDCTNEEIIKKLVHLNPLLYIRDRRVSGNENINAFSKEDNEILSKVFNTLGSPYLCESDIDNVRSFFIDFFNKYFEEYSTKGSIINTLGANYADRNVGGRFIEQTPVNSANAGRFFPTESDMDSDQFIAINEFVLRVLFASKGITHINKLSNPLVIMEDIESRLSPMLSARFWMSVKNLRAQKIVTTNAEAIIEDVEFRNIRRLWKGNYDVVCFKIDSDHLGFSNARKVHHQLLFNRPKALFSRIWIFVEGESEEWLLKRIASIRRRSLFSCGICIVPFAQCGLEPLIKTAVSYGIKYMVLTDSDEAGNRYVECAKNFSSKEQAKYIYPLPAVDIEHFLYKNGFAETYAEVVKQTEVGKTFFSSNLGKESVNNVSLAVPFIYIDENEYSIEFSKLNLQAPTDLINDGLSFPIKQFQDIPRYVAWVLRVSEKDLIRIWHRSGEHLDKTVPSAAFSRYAYVIKTMLSCCNAATHKKLLEVLSLLSDACMKEIVKVNAQPLNNISAMKIAETAVNVARTICSRHGGITKFKTAPDNIKIALKIWFWILVAFSCKVVVANNIVTIPDMKVSKDAKKLMDDIITSAIKKCNKPDMMNLVCDAMEENPTRIPPFLDNFIRVAFKIANDSPLPS